MEEKNEFQTTLENGVQDDVRNNMKMEELQKELDELQALVIRTPEQEKRIKALQKEINNMNIQNQEEKANEEKNEKFKEKQEVLDIKTANYDQLLARKQEIKLALEKINISAVIDVAKREKLEKELKEIEAALLVLEIGELEEKDSIGKSKEDEQNVEEKQGELRDEQNLSGQEKAQKMEQLKELKQAYYNSMVALHERKMQSISNQKQKSRLTITDEEFQAEMELEAKMYEARDGYLELAKSDPYTELRTEHLKKEKEAREEIEMQLRNMAKRFKEIEDEIRKIDEREQEISGELLEEDITDSQKADLEKEAAELGVTRKKLELERSEIREKLDEAINIRRDRAVKRAGLEREHLDTLSYEDKKNYDYQQGKVATMNKNFDDATKQHYRNIKIRIEQREQRIKDLNKELKEIPETDFDRRLTLLNELDKEANMLEADRMAKSDLDRGIIPDQKSEAKDAEEKYEKEQERQGEFDKATEEARAIAEEQKGEIGKAVVENPELANNEEKDREAASMAATFAIVNEPDKDTDVEAVVGDGGHDKDAECVIPGLDEHVKTLDATEEGIKNAEEYLAQDENIREASGELERVEDSIGEIQ